MQSQVTLVCLSVELGVNVFNEFRGISAGWFAVVCVQGNESEERVEILVLRKAGEV